MTDQRRIRRDLPPGERRLSGRRSPRSASPTFSMPIATGLRPMTWRVMAVSDERVDRAVAVDHELDADVEPPVRRHQLAAGVDLERRGSSVLEWGWRCNARRSCAARRRWLPDRSGANSASVAGRDRESRASADALGVDGRALRLVDRRPQPPGRRRRLRSKPWRSRKAGERRRARSRVAS
jgi:hypothetical protein